VKFVIVTLFPEFFRSPLEDALLGKALGKGLLEVEYVNPRDFTEDVHQTVDDVPFGGGAGMVMMAEPLVRAIESVKNRIPVSRSVYMSPRGKVLTQDYAQNLAKLDTVLLLCGRYEGIDQRILDGGFIDEELSLGDFVLAGGETAALALIETVSRLMPGTMGNQESLSEESHAAGRLEYPQYTRPRVFRGMEAPEVLLSGHHGKVKQWRSRQSLLLTLERRPDLVERWPLSREEQKLLDNSR
jgi:tRNA (guanine37-N1)-methyltransferase